MTPLERLKELSESGLREQLADIEHQRWSDWHNYMRSKGRKAGEIRPGQLLQRRSGTARE